MKALILFAVLGTLSGVGLAQQGLPREVMTLGDGTDPLWTIKSIRGDADHPSVLDRIKVYNNKVSPPVYLCEYVSNDQSFFTGAKIVKISKYPRPLLATSWILGVRSRCLRILDPSLGKGALVGHYCSLDLRWEIKEDHIDIFQSGYADKNSSALVDSDPISWPEEPKASQTDNPSAPQNQ